MLKLKFDIPVMITVPAKVKRGSLEGNKHNHNVPEILAYILTNISELIATTYQTLFKAKVSETYVAEPGRRTFWTLQ